MEPKVSIMLARVVVVAVVFIVCCAGVKNIPLRFSLGLSVGKAQES